MQSSIMTNYKMLKNQGITFDFLTFCKENQMFEEEIKRLNGKVFKLTSRRENILKNYIEVRDFFYTHSNEYNAIHFHQGITYYLPLKYAYKYNYKNRIIHNHGIDLNLLKKINFINELYLKRRICGLAQKYISCNMNLNNHLFTDKIINSKKVDFMPNAIDVDKYLFSLENRKKIRKSFNFTETDIVLGHVGLFLEVKNHKFILEMFKELHHIDSRYKLILVGEGELQESIKEIIIKENLDRSVFVIGKVSNVEEYLSAMDIFVFPSLFEGLPLALIEAQAAGLPIIASENIQKNVNIIGLCKFLPINDVNIWIKYINTDINKNDFNKRLIYGNKLANTVYNVKNNCLKLLKLYEEEK